VLLDVWDGIQEKVVVAVAMEVIPDEPLM